MTAEMTTADYNAKVDAQMSEAELQAFVRQAAKQFGWLYFHVHDSRHSPSGFPDCVMVRGVKLIFAELKRENVKKLPPAQQEWADGLGNVCGYVWHYVWRPSDWSDGTILEALRW